METIREILQKSFLGNSVQSYAVCLSIFIGSIVVLKIVKLVVLKQLAKLAEKSVNTIDDFIIHAFRVKLFPLFYFGAFYLSIQGLKLPLSITKGFNTLWIVLLIFFLVRFILDIVVLVLEKIWAGQVQDESKKDSLGGLIIVIKFAVWSIAAIILLDNLGFKISTLVAGLGIGGVAIALAAQAILGDLFSYITIFFDRPFELGDFIIIGDYLGTVEHIGIKTTRIRSLGGEELIFSNTDLTNSRVRNYKRMQKRRVVFKLGLTYQTTSAQIKEAPVIIKNIFKTVKDTVFDRVHFLAFGAFSLDIEVVYYVLSADYNKYMDIQQEINFKIKDEFEKKGLEFAYPTQTLFVNKS
ncbi:MAG: mechanosensitive ion channel family protein [bacterium]